MMTDSTSTVTGTTAYRGDDREYSLLTVFDILGAWMSEPDDLGEDWWAEFEAEFERFTFREVSCI